MPPAPKVLRVGHAGPGFDRTLAAQRTAQELGAMVVVEDTFLALPTLPASAHWWFLQWRNGDGTLPLAFGPQAGPMWMNPSVVRAGGNVVNQVFGFGGVGF